MKRASFQRKLYLAAGMLFLVLGALGVVIPVLPTTPFLLLAAAMFMRSSGRFYLWLTNHRLFGAFIRNYRLYRAVPLRSKVLALVFLVLTIGYSVIFVLESWWLRALLLAVAIVVSRHIIRLKTLTPDMLAEIRRRELSAGALPAVKPDPALD